METERLENVFDALQKLEIPPTPNNVSIMNFVYNLLREVYKELEKNDRTKNITDDEKGA